MYLRIRISLPLTVEVLIHRPGSYKGLVIIVIPMYAVTYIKADAVGTTSTTAMRETGCK